MNPKPLPQKERFIFIEALMLIDNTWFLDKARDNTGLIRQAIYKPDYNDSRPSSMNSHPAWFEARSWLQESVFMQCCNNIWQHNGQLWVELGNKIEDY